MVTANGHFPAGVHTGYCFDLFHDSRPNSVRGSRVSILTDFSELSHPSSEYGRWSSGLRFLVSGKGQQPTRATSRGFFRRAAANRALWLVSKIKGRRAGTIEVHDDRSEQQ